MGAGSQQSRHIRCIEKVPSWEGIKGWVMIKSIFIFVILLYASDAFAYRYIVEGTIAAADKAEADMLKVDLAALSAITAPDKLEIIQKAEVDKTTEEKETGKEYVSLEIIFTNDKEAEDYFNTMFVTITGEGRVQKHKCMHKEMGELENSSCVEVEVLILKKE